MKTGATRLDLFDLDHTLYRSPDSPKPDPVWYFHAHSFGTPGAPGFDGRWVLPVLTQARHSSLDPMAMTVVLTGRAEHLPMRKAIQSLLHLTGLQFDAVLLQPLLFVGTTAQYKAREVARLLKVLPSVRKVVLYDDDDRNHEAVGALVKGVGLTYKGWKP